MSIPVLVHRTLADALQAAVTDLRFVGTAKEFGALRQGAVTWPSAYVIPLGESAGPNRYKNMIVSQAVTVQIGIVLAIRDIAPLRSDDLALSEIEVLRPQIIEFMGLYEPPDGNTTCIHTKGQLLSGIGQGGEMFWQDTFEAEFDRRIN